MNGNKCSLCRCANIILLQIAHLVGGSFYYPNVWFGEGMGIKKIKDMFLEGYHIIVYLISYISDTILLNPE